MKWIIIQIISEETGSSETKKLEDEIDEIESLLDKGKDNDDTRLKTLEMLRNTLKKIDKEEGQAEWPSVEEELKDVLKRLRENNEKYGDDPKITEFINQLSNNTDDIISKKDTRTAKDLIDQMRALNY